MVVRKVHGHHLLVALEQLGHGQYVLVKQIGALDVDVGAAVEPPRVGRARAQRSHVLDGAVARRQGQQQGQPGSAEAGRLHLRIEKKKKNCLPPLPRCVSKKLSHTE